MSQLQYKYRLFGTHYPVKYPHLIRGAIRPYNLHTRFCTKPVLDTQGEHQWLGVKRNQRYNALPFGWIKL